MKRSTIALALALGGCVTDHPVSFRIVDRATGEVGIAILDGRVLHDRMQVLFREEMYRGRYDTDLSGGMVASLKSDSGKTLECKARIASGGIDPPLGLYLPDTFNARGDGECVADDGTVADVRIAGAK